MKTKPQKVTLEKAIRKLTELYGKALTLSYVRKPLSWAMYYTWQYIDSIEKSRISDDFWGEVGKGTSDGRRSGRKKKPKDE